MTSLAERAKRIRSAHEAGARDTVVEEMVDLMYPLADRLEGLALATSDGNAAAAHVLDRAALEVCALIERLEREGGA